MRPPPRSTGHRGWGYRSPGRVGRDPRRVADRPSGVRGGDPGRGRRSSFGGTAGRRGRRDPGTRPSMRAGGPLAGKVVLVTRPRDQSEGLVRELERRGGTAIVAPTIEVAPVRSADLGKTLRELSAGAFAWIALTSRTTVDVLAARLEPSEVQARAAAVGEGTGAAVRPWDGASAE